MVATIKIAAYTNADDAFVAWAPSEHIPGYRGFLLERARKSGGALKVESVVNRIGCAAVSYAAIENDKRGEIAQERLIPPGLTCV